MTDFRIIICADAKFFRFLPALEANIKRKFGQYPVIFDLGFAEHQLTKLKSDVIKIQANSTYADMTPQGNVRATHKSACVLSFFDRYGANCLYVDADVFFTDSIAFSEFAGADVCVTPRHPRELVSKDPFGNGKINAGVLYFRHTPQVIDLVKAWDEECANQGISDQLALTRVLEAADLTGHYGDVQLGDIVVRKLDPVIYNDTGTHSGRIWHFKNAGRRFHKLRRLTYVGWIDGVVPGYLNWLATRRRRAHQPAVMI